MIGVGEFVTVVLIGPFFVVLTYVAGINLFKATSR